jgi:hypothetical protein
VWTIVQLVVGGSPQIKEDCDTIRLHWVNEVTIVGRYVHRDVPKRIDVNVNSVGAKLIEVDERVVQQLTHPNCFIKKKNAGHSSVWLVTADAPVTIGTFRMGS